MRKPSAHPITTTVVIAIPTSSLPAPFAPGAELDVAAGRVALLPDCADPVAPPDSVCSTCVPNVVDLPVGAAEATAMVAPPTTTPPLAFVDAVFPSTTTAPFVPTETTFPSDRVTALPGGIVVPAITMAASDEDLSEELGEVGEDGLGVIDGTEGSAGVAGEGSAGLGGCGFGFAGEGV